MASEIIRKTGIYLLGNAGSKLLGIVLIPIYSFFVPPAELGTFDFVVTIAGLAAIVYFVAVWESIIRFAMAREDARDADEVIRSSIIVGLGASLALGVTAGVVLLAIGGHVEEVITGALIAALTGIVKVWQYAARAKRQSKLFAISGLVQAVINLAFVAILICVLRWGLTGLLVSYIAGLLAALVLLEVRVGLLRLRGWKWPPRSLISTILRFTFPLMLNLITIGLLEGYGRILITATLGPEANGQFAFAMRIALAVTMLGQVLSMASIEETVLRIGTPSLAPFYSTLLTSAWTLMLAGGALTVVAAQVLYTFLDSTAYAGSLVLVPALVLWGALSVMATTYGNAFQVAQKTAVIAWTTFAGLIVSVGISLLTVWQFGTLGVALSMALGMMVTVSIRRLFAAGYVRFSEGRSALIAGAIFVFAAFWSIYPLPVVWKVIGMAGAAAAGVIVCLLALRDLNRAPNV